MGVGIFCAPIAQWIEYRPAKLGIQVRLLVGAPRLILRSSAMTGKNNKKETKTGKYVYDEKLGKIVKVSDKITGLKKGGETGTCPTGGCCGI